LLSCDILKLLSFTEVGRVFLSINVYCSVFRSVCFSRW
jgi:hypothetical protein